MKKPKKILFLTGTRADFGKLKPLIRAIAQNTDFEYMIFVTGMHTLDRYGYTLDEVYKAGFSNVHVFMNQLHGEPSELILSNTISGLSRFVHEYRPDMIVVHGDRIEALAGAIVGALQNILVSHIEGGEISGTIDELIRHSVSKLSHLHFVSNNEAADRLFQMGENSKSIFIIGSPDVDVMLSSELPSLETVKNYYEISFDQYAIAMLHSVTTELDLLKEHSQIYVSSLIESGLKYIVVYPNNDPGNEIILEALKKLKGNSNFRIFPSIRFEYFLTLLKNAQFIVGNSSAGIREAPIYSLPTVNIGTRQLNRYNYPTIINCKFDKGEIINSIDAALNQKPSAPSLHFGKGNSTTQFTDILKTESTWLINHQKQFIDFK